jgi:Family of unknown function (DUF6174)
VTGRDAADLERDLGSRLESLAARPAAGMLDRVMADVSATPQRNGRWTWAHADWSRWLALAGVAAAALVIGIVIGSSRGLLFVGDAASPTPSSTEEPSPSAGPTQVAWTEPASYVYVFDSQCGLRTLSGRYEVAVEDGEPVAFRRVGEGPWVPHNVDDMPTLGDLANLVERARADGNAIVRAHEVDPEDGHPTHIDIDWLPNAIDDEECYLIEYYDPGLPGTESPEPGYWLEPPAYRFVVQDTRCGGGERNYFGTWELTVRNGEISASRPIDETAKARPVPNDELPTLRWIEDRISEAERGGSPVVEIERDPADGHLTLARIDWLPNAIDDEECYRITSYTPDS